MIGYINDAYKERKIRPEKYTKTKVKLVKIEEIRGGMLEVLPSADPTKPWKRNSLNYNKDCLENKMVYLIPHENISLSCFSQIFEQKMTQKSQKKKTAFFRK